MELQPAPNCRLPVPPLRPAQLRPGPSPPPPPPIFLPSPIPRPPLPPPLSPLPYLMSSVRMETKQESMEGERYLSRETGHL
jgi:hypothetical protein